MKKFVMSIFNRKQTPNWEILSGGQQEQSWQSFDGRLINITGRQLVMKSKHGGETSHSFSKDARLPLDGSSCNADAWKVGRNIRVATQQDDCKIGSGVEAIDEQPEVAWCKIEVAGQTLTDPAGVDTRPTADKSIVTPANHRGPLLS